jgi:hypothetical protein
MGVDILVSFLGEVKQQNLAGVFAVRFHGELWHVTDGGGISTAQVVSVQSYASGDNLQPGVPSREKVVRKLFSRVQPGDGERSVLLDTSYSC